MVLLVQTVKKNYIWNSDATTMIRKQKATGIIPARYASTRFPGKPLALLGGRPMVQWVYEGCRAIFDHLVVATDDHRIREAVEAFGGNVIMTSSEHTTGTERCSEAARILAEQGIQSDIVVNIQGDEPFIQKEQLIELLDCFDDARTEIATLARAFDKDEDTENPNIVKVAMSKTGRALYFSRSPIPYLRIAKNTRRYHYLKHVGIYAFRYEVLQTICGLPPGDLEQAESLEQLRWLENDFMIRVYRTAYSSYGVDTPEDLEILQKRIDTAK